MASRHCSMKHYYLVQWTV